MSTDVTGKHVTLPKCFCLIQKTQTMDYLCYGHFCRSCFMAKFEKIFLAQKTFAGFHLPLTGERKL